MVANPTAASGPDGELVLRCDDVRKAFRAPTSLVDLARLRLRGARVEALLGVELELGAGEVLGLLGKNGAGKSTLLRIVAGLLLADSGSVEVFGAPLLPSVGAAHRARVAYVIADERSFAWRLSARQNLRFFATLYGLSGSAARERVEHSLDVVGLERGAIDRPVSTFSSGMRARLTFARALLGDPELWLFDEPTRGLDPRAAEDAWRFIRDDLVARGASAVIASHDLREVDSLCDRVALLDGGVIAARGAANEARTMLGVDGAL